MSHHNGAAGGLWGGVTVLLLRINMIMTTISVQQRCETGIMAAFGAVIGFFVHLGLEFLTKKIKKRYANSTSSNT